MMSTEPRVAIVTGASRGLGAVVARVLGDRRYVLVINARDPESLRSMAEELQSRTRSVISIDGDVADAAVRARLVDAARDCGGLDVLVNNASELGVIAPIANLDAERFARVLQVNVVAPAALSRLAVPLLAERSGLIVNITSDAANGAYAGWGAYGASKAALELLTRTLAGELRDLDVSAIAVDPGDLRTRMHQEAFPGEDISDRPLPDVTVPFWQWLFDQRPRELSGRRFAAQQEDAPWLQQV
jgi:NAD(P)-dependent dehydrogenase (short-subunit alcohol dehydrogenase family)